MDPSVTSTKTLSANSFWVETVSMITRNSITRGDRFWGCGVNITILIIFHIFTNWSIATIYSFRVVTLYVRWPVQQLFSTLCITSMMYSYIITTLPIFCTVLIISKKSLGFGAIKAVIRTRSWIWTTTILITVSAITIPVSAANMSWKIAPTVNRIKKIVFFTGDVIQAAIVAFPVF